MAKHRTDQEWASILSAFRRSGLSQAAFCRRRGFALSTFRLRLAAAQRDALPSPACEDGASRHPGAALLEIALAGSPSEGRHANGLGLGIPVEIAFPGGVRASLAVPSESHRDLNSSPPYDWSDPTVAAFGGDSERSDSKSAKATAVANWDVEGEVTSRAEFQWTLGTASFQRQSEGVKKAVVQAKVDSIVSIHLIADFGIGEHRLKFRIAKNSNTEASKNPDRIEWEFSAE